MIASEAPIKDFALGIYDGPHATPPECSEGAVFLGIKNFSPEGHLDFSEVRFVSEADLPKWTRRVVPQEGDVVFTYEATLHRYALIPSGFRGCLGRRVALVRPDPTKLDHRFLYYYFRSPAWRAVIESNVITGATVDRIPIERFPSFPLRAPSLPKQTNIAAILTYYDDLIENNRRRMVLLEEAARKLYREWFIRLRFPGHEHTPIRDGLPEGWERRTAYDTMEILSGGTPKTTNPAFWDGEIPFYTPKDAVPGIWVAECERNITESGLQHCNSRLYPRQTVFISARGSVGKLCMAQRPMAMSQSCYALVGRGHVTQVFVFCAMQQAVQALKQQAVGAVFDAIIVDTFKRISLLVPDPSVLKSFSNLATPLFLQIENLAIQNRKLRTARDRLLPKLMSGEISV